MIVTRAPCPPRSARVRPDHAGTDDYHVCRRHTGTPEQQGIPPSIFPDARACLDDMRPATRLIGEATQADRRAGDRFVSNADCLRVDQGLVVCAGGAMQVRVEDLPRAQPHIGLRSMPAGISACPNPGGVSSTAAGPQRCRIDPTRTGGRRCLEEICGPVMITKSRTASYRDIPMVARGEILYTYLHLAPDRPQTRALIDSKAVALLQTITGRAAACRCLRR